MSAYNPDLVKQELLVPKEEPLDEVAELAPAGAVPMNEENGENEEGQQDGTDIKPITYDMVLRELSKNFPDHPKAVASLWLLRGLGESQPRATTKKPKWQCPFCPLSSAHDSGKCNGCGMWVHTKCAGFQCYKDFPKNFKCAKCHPQ